MFDGLVKSQTHNGEYADAHAVARGGLPQCLQRLIAIHLVDGVGSIVQPRFEHKNPNNLVIDSNNVFYTGTQSFGELKSIRVRGNITGS